VKGKGGGLLALISGGGDPSEESESDPFEQGFKAFRGALKSGDAMKAKKAFRLMKEACDEDSDEDEEYDEES